MRGIRSRLRVATAMRVGGIVGLEWMFAFMRRGSRAERVIVWAGSRRRPARRSGSGGTAKVDNKCDRYRLVDNLEKFGRYGAVNN